MNGLLFAAALAAMALPSAARPNDTGGIHVQRDIAYSAAGGTSQLLDLYIPNRVGPGLRPALIFVHGGGWSGGDKSEFASRAEEMAHEGYIAVSVNYRLAPANRFPAAVDDVQNAVRWLKDHAQEYQIDTKRIGAMGASAGGHLAAFLGVTESLPGGSAAGLQPARVACVVDYFGRMDLNLPQGGTDYRKNFTGESGPGAAPAYRAASPITYVNAHTCPFLIVQGMQDPQVGREQSERMNDALQRAGVETSLLLLGGQGHGFHGRGEGLAWAAARAFFAAHLHPDNGL